MDLSVHHDSDESPPWGSEGNGWDPETEGVGKETETVRTKGYWTKGYREVLEQEVESPEELYLKSSSRTTLLSLCSPINLLLRPFMVFHPPLALSVPFHPLSLFSFGHFLQNNSFNGKTRWPRIRKNSLSSVVTSYTRELYRMHSLFSRTR